MLNDFIMMRLTREDFEYLKKNDRPTKIVSLLIGQEENVLFGFEYNLQSNTLKPKENFELNSSLEETKKIKARI